MDLYSIRCVQSNSTKVLILKVEAASFPSLMRIDSGSLPSNDDFIFWFSALDYWKMIQMADQQLLSSND